MRKTIVELEKTVHRLRQERQAKRDIFEAIHDGIIVLTPNLSVQFINQNACQLLSINEAFNPQQQTLSLYKNKKSTLSFSLYDWLKETQQQNNPTCREELVWHTNPLTLTSSPLLLSAKTITGPETEAHNQNLLLVIYDHKVHKLADEQKRLMYTAFHSHNAQFIANEKGRIIEANDSFFALSGYSKQSIKKTSLMKWLDEQVRQKDSLNSLLKTLLKQSYWSGEVEIYPYPDTVFDAVMTISMVKDDEANVEHYIVNLQNITDIREAQKKLERMALYDDLTGLANRKLTLAYIERLLKTHHRNYTFSSLIYINLDRFKGINDAFGRRTGDRFLIKVTDLLTQTLREADSISRVSGDEFTVIPQEKSATYEAAYRNALKVTKKISKTLNQRFIVDNLTLHSSVRLGVVILPISTDDHSEDILVKADLASDRAKLVHKRHKIFFYEKSLSEQVIQHRQLEQELAEAFQKGQIELYFQPQIRQPNALYGAESLARWRHPEKGFISPAIFIAIAEESRIMVKLGAWIVFNAFKTAKRWSQWQEDFNLSVNISPIQFHEADFIENILSIRKATQVNPHNVTLELTESVLIADADLAIEKLHQLSKEGFKISIDDFGTGYSSLSYFQKLPIHELKIDQSFIKGLPDHSQNAAIVDAITRLAESKHIMMVAEGVETAEQAQFLHIEKPDAILQGYYFSKPLPANEFEARFFKS